MPITGLIRKLFKSKSSEAAPGGVESELVPELSSTEKAKAEKSIEKKYAKVANGPKGYFKYPTGTAGLRQLGYGSGLIAPLPAEVAESFCGVGNPFSLADMVPGEKIVDIGCGAGLDTIMAAKMVSPGGSAAGIDMVSRMLDTARRNAGLAGADNVKFIECAADKLDFPDGSFDAAISNGVFNLVVDKQAALTEVYRVLKPGGRLMIADQVRCGQMPKETSVMVKSWGR